MEKILSKFLNCFTSLFSEKETIICDEGKLYPKKLTSEEMELYNDYLNQIIIDKKIKNVAITGPYGIGKSSVLETYFQNDELKRKTVFVNLPDFWQVKTTKQNKDESKYNYSNDESVLQRKILEQIIYGNNENIPFFPLKKSKIQSKRSSLLFITFLIISFLLVPNIVNSFSRWNWQYSWFTTLSQWEWFANIFALSFLGYLSWYFFNLIKISKISVKIFGQGISFEKKDELPFSKYAEELITFFRYSKKEYIIIEDLDRYKYTGIYKELRDLNQLINRSLKEKKRVVFIYALRDTLIVEENEKSSVETKAKFFDYVIPILSNTSFNNGFEALNQELKNISVGSEDSKRTLESLFEEKDLRILGHYLNGQRSIKLIVSETKQLLRRVLSFSGNSQNEIEDKLNYIGIPPKEIFGSVIYKNFYPHEYEKSKNHDADIDKFSDSLQLIIFKMNEELSLIKNKKSKLTDFIEEYKEDEQLLNEDLKKNILVDFLKSFKETNIYFIVNNSWIMLNLSNMDSAYKILENKLEELDIENIVFYKGQSKSDSYIIKSITKNNLKKGKYTLSYEEFNNFETVGDKIIDWERQRETYEKRIEILESQNDFSTVFKFIKEKDSEGSYQHIEKENLKSIIKNIEEDQLKDVLFSNGFVTLNFNNILSSFPNSKLNGNDREIIEKVTLGNTIELDKTVYNPSEVINEINRIGLEYSQIESYSIAENLFEDKSESAQNNLNLILKNWKEKHCTLAGYGAFDKENYKFFNYILSNWSNGLVNEQNEFLNTDSFFRMLVNEKVEVELVKQPYIRAINTKAASEDLNHFIKENAHLANQLLRKFDNKMNFSNVAIFDYNVLQQMLNFNLFSNEKDNIVQIVKSKFKGVFNFSFLAEFLTEYKQKPIVSKLFIDEEFFYLIKDINANSDELLDNEESIEKLLLLIELIKEKINDPSSLILEILERAKISDIELSISIKQKITELVDVDKLTPEVVGDEHNLIDTFCKVVGKRILYYHKGFITWFNLVDIETKIVILDEIFYQFNSIDDVEELFKQFINYEKIDEVLHLYNSKSPTGVKFVLIKMFSQEAYFSEDLTPEIINEVAEYIIENNIENEKLFINFSRINSLAVDRRVFFTQKLIDKYEYSIIEIAKHLSIEEEMQLIIEKNKNEISCETYSEDIYTILKALDKMGLIHLLNEKNDKIYYRLKSKVKDYV